MPGDKGLYAKYINEAQGIRVLDEGKSLVKGLPFSKLGSGGLVYWNPSNQTEIVTTKGTQYANTTITLGHELFHAYDANTGHLDTRRISINGGLEERSEIRAVYFANQLRMQIINSKGNRKVNYYRLQYNKGGPNLIKNGQPINVPPPSFNLLK